MQRIKMILFASAMAVALCAFGASAASAGTGTVAFAGGNPCDITFNSTGGPPTPPAWGSTTIDNVNESTSDPDCSSIDIVNPTTILYMDFDGAGNVGMSGVIRIKVSGFVNCVYSVPNIWGTYGPNSASVSGLISRTSAGSFLCPDPTTLRLNISSF
jgi:hypothetical protein